MAIGPDADQSLRLLKAFAGVQDEKTRELLIALAESAQRGERIKVAPVGDGHDDALTDKPEQ